MNKYYKPLTLVIAFLILSLVTVASFAYFSASVQGNDNVYDTVITTGEMALMLNDGEQVGLNNAIPGDSITKEFSVKNTGTVETTYDVYFSELLNEFEDKNDLVYTLTSENGCADGNEKIVPSVSSDESKMVNSCTINPNQTHNYTLTIAFKDDETNQDDNKGKRFSTKIGVNEYKEYQYIAKLVDGESFNVLIKSLTINEDEYNEFVSVALNENGFHSPEFDIYCKDKLDKCNFFESVYDAREYNSLLSIDGTYIKNIEIINEIPQNTSDMLMVSSNDSYYNIYVRYDNETIFIYTDQDEIYLNENSSYLFYGLNKIENLDLKKVNTSNVTNMAYMLSGMTGRIELDERFNTSNVVDMHSMFSSSNLSDYSFINNFDISSVTDMHEMFWCAGKGAKLQLNNFNASNVVDMNRMFMNSYFESIDLGDNFNAMSVVNMDSMFANTEAKSIYLGNNFNAKSATNMRTMFNSNENTEIVDLGDNFNADSDVNVWWMFYQAGKHLNLGKNFNGSNITDMSEMFYYFYGDSIDLGDNFDTSSATNMYSMFRGCNVEVLDLGDSFDTSYVINMDTMFAYSRELKSIYLGNKFYVSKDTDVKNMFASSSLEHIYVGKDVFFDLTNINNIEYVFDSAKDLVGGAGTTYSIDHRSIEYARIDDPEHGKPGYLTLDPRYQ